MRRLILHLLVLGLAGQECQAQFEKHPVPTKDRPPIFSRISDLFGGDLPQLDPPGEIKLILRPHFGDLVRRDYMRVDTGLRWALNKDFELSAAASVFFTHGLGDSASYGIGKLRFGSKYVFEDWPKPAYETTVALNVDLPVGHAPIDMTDGFYHFAPNFVVQHLSDWNHHLILFAGMGLDLIDQSRVAGRFGTNQPHDDSISITAGGVYDMGQIKWTLTNTYATTAVIGSETQHFYYLQPGLLWYVPKRFTFNSKTQWIVALGARTSWGPDGFDFGLRTRVRAEITFRQVMDTMRRRASR